MIWDAAFGEEGEMATQVNRRSEGQRPERELEITYWLLDTRSLWPGQKIAEAVGIHDIAQVAG